MFSMLSINDGVTRLTTTINDGVTCLTMTALRAPSFTLLQRLQISKVQYYQQATGGHVALIFT